MPSRKKSQSPAEAKRAGWKQDPEAVKANILRIARAEFARNGLSGSRVDDIAEKTQTSKRMIYYYFQDKMGLYRAALEASYQEVRVGEDNLDLDDLPPREALRRLVEFTFDYHRANPEHVRLAMIENVHHGNNLKQSPIIQEQNRGAIDHLERILEKGRREGVFRADADPIFVHWQISALCVFNVSNQHTFTLLHGHSLHGSGDQNRLKGLIVDSVLRSVGREC